MEIESLTEDDSPSSNTITSRLFQLAVNVDAVYTPLLCLFGTIGNCLSIVVFFTKSHNARGSLSSSVYLSALAISDTGFLINLFIMWIDNMGISLLSNSFICSGVMYAGQVMGFLSVWFIVAFTVERFFAVCYPLFRPSKCTASRAKKIAFGLTAFAVIAFSYVWVITQVQVFSLSNDPSENTTFESHEMTKTHESVVDGPATTFVSIIEPKMWTNNSYPHSPFPPQHEVFLPIDTTTVSQEDNGPPFNAETLDKGSWDNVKSSVEHSSPALEYMCSVPKKYYQISLIYTYLDSILTFILPFILISALNMKIILCVRRIKRHRESMLASSMIMQSHSHHNNKRQPPPAPGSLSGKEKMKLKNCLTSFQQNKKPSSTRIKGKGRKSTLTSTMNEVASPSCSNHKSNFQDGHTSKYLREGSYDDAKNCVDVEHRTSSIESDSQTSAGQVTPPFKHIVSAPTPPATEIRVTKTLLLVSSVFLILHLPSHTIRIASFLESLNGGSYDRISQFTVAQYWANHLFNTNFAINFLLYCCSGKAFRRSVKNLFSKDFHFTKNRQSPRNASTTAITTQLTLHTDSVSIPGKYSARVVKYSCSKVLEEDQL